MIGLQGYRLLHVIGTGGMGCVYEAEREQNGERVAIKFVTAADITMSEHLKARMAREARAVSNLVSPHLVRVFEVGEEPDSGLSFLVMELLHGEDMQQLLDRAAPLAPTTALALVAQACAGLHVAHEARVVHRDVKPANLYLSRDGAGGITVKILDFGVAKIKMDEALGGGTHNLTRTGSILGSPLYMSPEQARGAKNIDRRSDVWSLGVVLYHALTGRTPFHDVDALGELIMAICQRPAPLVQDFAPWVSPALAALVHGALRIDPNERFPSAEAMGSEIAKLLPGGSRLSQMSLTQIAPGEKKLVATRLIVTAPSSSSPRTGAPSEAISAPSMSSLVVTDHSSTAGLANSRETERRAGGTWRLVGGAVAAGGLIAAIAGAVHFSTRTPDPAAPLSGSVPPPESAAPPIPTPTPVGPTSGGSAPRDPPSTTEAVVVEPTAPTTSASAAASGVAPATQPSVKAAPKGSAKAPVASAKPVTSGKPPAPPDSAVFGGRE